MYAVTFAPPGLSALAASDVVRDVRPNDAPACYRARVVFPDRHSGWSAPACVTPRATPFAPAFTIALDTESNLSRTLKTMEGYGLVRLERGERGRVSPKVTYDRVELDLPLTG